MPLATWLQALGADDLAAQLHAGRNHYDRLVHFAYGLLCSPALAELGARTLTAHSRAAAGLLPLSLVMASSMLYELFEWGAAELFGGELGQAFLGTQGDAWDAQKDMALASLGSALALCAMALQGSLVARPRVPC